MARGTPAQQATFYGQVRDPLRRRKQTLTQIDKQALKLRRRVERIAENRRMRAHMLEVWE